MAHQDDPSEEQMLRGIASLSVKPFVGSFIEWAGTQEMPNTPAGTFPRLIRQFEELYESGVIRIDTMSDEEASMGTEPLAVNHQMVQEEERVHLLLSIHPNFTLNTIMTSNRRDYAKAMVRFIDAVIEVIKRYEQLKRAGARFP